MGAPGTPYIEADQKGSPCDVPAKVAIHALARRCAARPPAPIPTAKHPFRQRQPAQGPVPAGLETAIFGLGCFWGAERKFWELARRLYDGGRLCRRLHAQPDLRGGLLTAAPATTRSCGWCSTRRRSATRRCSRSSGRATTRPRACARATTWAPSIAPASTSTRPAQRAAAEASQGDLSRRRSRPGRYGAITTEIVAAPRFYFAEDYHQQYLAKNPTWLLRPRRHRRQLPDRDGGGGGGVAASLATHENEGRS